MRAGRGFNLLPYLWGLGFLGDCLEEKTNPELGGRLCDTRTKLVAAVDREETQARTRDREETQARTSGQILKRAGCVISGKSLRSPFPNGKMG